MLFFPRQGQTCHAYCTNCFRWAQFVDEPDLKMASDDTGSLLAYLRAHPEVTSALITGGDPMIMGEPVLRRYLEPLLDPALEQLKSIRIRRAGPRARRAAGVPAKYHRAGAKHSGGSGGSSPRASSIPPG